MVTNTAWLRPWSSVFPHNMLNTIRANSSRSVSLERTNLARI